MSATWQWESLSKWVSGLLGEAEVPMRTEIEGGKYGKDQLLDLGHQHRIKAGQSPNDQGERIVNLKTLGRGPVVVGRGDETVCSTKWC